MDASSPLAGMQPSFTGNCGFQLEAPRPYASFSSKNFGPDAFNFKDLSMKKSNPDYFSLQKPARGSSPTASLAADLSQNFHIDKSPQLPTPRRALFSNNFFGGHNVSLNTPPIPSSSPAPLSDGMEISPLPHKIPLGSSFATHLQSPTPELVPADSSMLSLPSPPTSDSLLDPPILIFPEKKRFGALRPGLTRAKGLSTSDIPQRVSSESQLPPFRFGNGITSAARSSSLSLCEIFIESPPREKSLPRHLPVMPPPRSRPVFGLASNMRTNGSPVSGHMRKSSNPMVRPRKQFRRSLSMFEHPEDVVRQEKCAPTLPSIMDIEHAHVPQLPHFNSEPDSCELPRIARETLVDIIDGKYNQHYEKFVIIDCRFEYEYNGGHIEGAVNFNDKEKLTSQLFDLETQGGSICGPRTLLVFHCEYSAHRAPIMAKFVRNRDRTVNAERYPQLTYPEAYILDGGYSSFFKDYRARCFPQNYVEMDAKEHARACEMGMGKVKQRSKLIRAQTFAFGQHGLENSSPTSAPGRSGRSPNDSMDFEMDLGLGSDLVSQPFAKPVLEVRPPPRTLRMSSY